MSALQEHLNKTYPHGADLSDLPEHFKEKFGVNVRNDDGVYLFKYSQIDANWQDKVTHECRGSILLPSPDGWKFQSRPFDKFFNVWEGHCELFDENTFKERTNNLSAVEKHDGTCIQLWNDQSGKWRVSTLGSILTSFVPDEDFSFSDLFHRTVDYDPKKLDPFKTYLLELCCEENRIVTKYDSNHAYLLGIRNRMNGSYDDIDAVRGIVDSGFGNVRKPLKQELHYINIDSHDALYKYVEEESKNSHLEYPEGFVIYDSVTWRPVAKAKNSKYVALHGTVGGGDLAHSKNQIVEAIFNGHFDDIEKVLSNRLLNFAHDVKDKVSELRTDAMHAAIEAKKQSFPDRKTFAMFVKSEVPKEVSGFFFKNADYFIDHKPTNISEEFDKWLTNHYKRFDWKE